WFGSVLAFSLVNAGLILLLFIVGDVPRAFKTPLFPLIPVLGIGFCGYLMLQLEARTWIAFAVWSAVGLIVYFVYGYQ
ncbi:amino acid permease C-terminal domain-containing protein, partial [Mycobacterium kansasii]